MKLITTKEFHDHVTKMLRSDQIVAITKHGRISGYYLPHKTQNLPPDVRWKIFEKATSRISKQLRKQGISEEELLEDFERWRKRYRASRSRR